MLCCPELTQTPRDHFCCELSISLLRIYLRKQLLIQPAARQRPHRKISSQTRSRLRILTEPKGRTISPFLQNDIRIMLNFFFLFNRKARWAEPPVTATLGLCVRLFFLHLLCYVCLVSQSFQSSLGFFIISVAWPNIRGRSAGGSAAVLKRHFPALAQTPCVRTAPALPHSLSKPPLSP